MPRIYKEKECVYCKKFKPIAANGLCRSCYSRYRRNGQLEKVKVRKVCSVEGCVNISKAQSVCGKHYLRLLKHGDVSRGNPDTWGKAQHHPLYKIWSGMRQRCNNKTNRDYPRYGGRGILICKRWDDFWLFVEDIGDRPTPSHSIDRINNNGYYEPENCKWSTPKEQARNRRNNAINKTLADKVHILLDHGLDVIDVCDLLNLNYDLVYSLKSKQTWR